MYQTKKAVNLIDKFISMCMETIQLNFSFAFEQNNSKKTQI